MVKLKICGLTRVADIAIANRVLPDYIGFVFAESRRKLSAAKAAGLAARLDPHIQKVGVFVNEEPAKIIDLCLEGIIDLVQLHGDEDEIYLKRLKAQIANPVIKAMRVRTAAQIAAAAKLSCDFLLLDTYSLRQYGGSGKIFDWGLIPPVSKPFFLAGGLNESNLLAALAATRAYAVDLSSGVETGGLKDEAKIAQVAAIVRSVN